MKYERRYDPSNTSEVWHKVLEEYPRLKKRDDIAFYGFFEQFNFLKWIFVREQFFLSSIYALTKNQSPCDFTSTL